jgi:hypothetical protein
VSKRPPLFRWIVIATVFLSACAGLWARWQSRSEQRYLEILGQIRDAVLPTALAELSGESVPPSDNAAPLYLRVIELADGRPNASFKNFPDISISAEIRKEVGEWKDILYLVDQAALKPRCVFPRDLEDRHFVIHTARLMSPCYLICARALQRLEEKYVFGALADIRTTFRVSEALRDEPNLLTQVVRMAICDTAVTALEVVLPHCESAVEAIEQIGLPSIRGAVRRGMHAEIAGFIEAFDQDAMRDEPEFSGIGRIVTLPVFQPYLNDRKSRHLGFLKSYADLLKGPYTISMPGVASLERERIGATRFPDNLYVVRIATAVKREARTESRLVLARLVAHIIDHEKKPVVRFDKSKKSTRSNLSSILSQTGRIA